jgi:hypothetical protein
MESPEWMDRGEKMRLSLAAESCFVRRWDSTARPELLVVAKDRLVRRWDNAVEPLPRSYRNRHRVGHATGSI